MPSCTRHPISLSTLHAGWANHELTTVAHRECRRRYGDRQTYEAVVSAVAGQLESGPGWERREPEGTLVVIPAVGFGHQSALVLPRTLSVLASQRDPERPIHVLTVVNRPQRWPADDTVELIRSAVGIEPPPPGAPIFATCEITLNRRPRIGELRQIALDAVGVAFGTISDELSVVVMDDDLVLAPPGLLAGLSSELTGGNAGLVIGPVLFDDPLVPTCLYAELYAADLVRALVTQRLLEVLAGSMLPEGFGAASSRAAEAVPAPWTYESLVLSGNLAVRHDALTHAGGFRDLNEVTGLLQDLVNNGTLMRTSEGTRHRSSTLSGAVGDRVANLVELAVRMSSRRAIAAWTAGKHPTVAQWSGCRLRSSKVDPVRVATAGQPPPPVPLRAMSPAALRALLPSISSALAVTADYLDPPASLMIWALHQLGLTNSGVSVRPPSTPGQRWEIKIARPGGLLDILDILQRFELEAREDPGSLWREPLPDDSQSAMALGR